MFDADAIKRQTDEKRDWEARELADFMRRQPEARPRCRTCASARSMKVPAPDVAAVNLTVVTLSYRSSPSVRSSSTA